MTAGQFLDTLNSAHPSLKFHRAPKIKSKVYIRRTNTGLLLSFQSHLDIKYKRSLVNTRVDRA